MLLSNKKRILILVDWFDPGYKAGGPIQSCKNFVKAFQSEYDLYVLTSDRDEGDAAPYEGIRCNHWLKYDKNVSVYYALLEHLSSNKVRTLIKEVHPDYILLNNMYSVKFTIIPLLLKFMNRVQATVVLSPRGMLQDGAMQFKTKKKKLFISLLNSLKIPRHIIFHATDEQERKDILKYFPKAGQVFIAENFGPVVDVKWTPVTKVPGELRLIFLSRISPKKNLLYALSLLKDIDNSDHLFFDIAGGIEDDLYWEQCRKIISELPSNIQVNYIGTINNNEVYTRYSHYHIFILPTLGENFGHAIFEALLSGKPVLLSDKTPWRGLADKNIGYDISLDEPIAFLKAINNFISFDQAEYDFWSKSAWSYANKYQVKGEVKEKYMSILK